MDVRQASACYTLPVVGPFGYSSVQTYPTLRRASSMPNSNTGFRTHPSLTESASRGVYSLPWTDRDGAMVLVAVDARGRRVAEAVVFHTIQPEAIAATLWEVLNQVDPPHRLQLVS